MLKATIDIDCVPSGYEPVRFGHPKAGEFFVESNDNGCGRIKSEVTDCELALRLIVRPIWQPSISLSPGWVAMDASGVWYWYDERPEYRLGDGLWTTNGEVLEITPCINWTPPPCTGPHDSLHEIKRGGS